MLCTLNSLQCNILHSFGDNDNHDVFFYFFFAFEIFIAVTVIFVYSAGLLVY